jgi:hypothetical protein
MVAPPRPLLAVVLTTTLVLTAYRAILAAALVGGFLR